MSAGRPPFDPQFDAMLTQLAGQMPLSFTREMIPAMRTAPEPGALSDHDLDALGVAAREVTIAGYRGEDISVTVIARKDHQDIGPGIYHTHGGGMISGTPRSGLPGVLPWVLEHDAVLVSVDYRLAPEFPDPYPIEDCYAGLLWTAEHAAELGIDPERLLITGSSAGGGLAAGTALLARDRVGPRLIGQLLVYPMLDDRNETVSSKQYDGVGLWDRESNLLGWTCLLGERRGTDEVSIYAAPARATDLAGLPPAYVDCGSAEVFRDEDVAYAGALWAAGVQAELHVWPGAFHGSDLLVPDHHLSRRAAEARAAWLTRLLQD